MSFLHSHNILHRNLIPDNIFIDDEFYPKIGNFELSTHIHTIESMTLQSATGFKGSIEYSSPEILQTNSFSKASDVYSFAILVYEILTNDISFKKIINASQFLIDVIIKGKRPEFHTDIPESYRKLIEKCWSQNPSDRPTFDEIVNELTNERGFIVDDVDEKKFKNYINYIEKVQIEFFSKQRVVQFNEHVVSDEKIEKDKNLASSSNSSLEKLKDQPMEIIEEDNFSNITNIEIFEKPKSDNKKFIETE